MQRSVSGMISLQRRRVAIDTIASTAGPPKDSVDAMLATLVNTVTATGWLRRHQMTV